MATPGPSVREVFDKYSARRGSLDFPQFAKLAEDCGLLDNKKAVTRDTIPQGSGQSPLKSAGFKIAGISDEKADNRSVNINISINVGVDEKGRPVIDSEAVGALLQDNLSQLVQNSNRPKMTKAVTVPKLLPSSAKRLSIPDGLSKAEQAVNDADGTLPNKPKLPRRRSQLTPRSLALLDQGGVRSLPQAAEFGCTAATAASKVGPRWLRLHELFEKYTAGQDGMDGAQFSRLASERGIVDAKCSGTDVALVFAEVALKTGGEAAKKVAKKGRRASQEAPSDLTALRISFAQFQRALEHCAGRRKEAPEDLIKALVSQGSAPAYLNYSSLAADPDAEDNYQDGAVVYLAGPNAPPRPALDLARQRPPHQLEGAATDAAERHSRPAAQPAADTPPQKQAPETGQEKRKAGTTSVRRSARKSM